MRAIGKTIQTGVLLAMLASGGALLAQENWPAAKGWLLGITGPSVEQPVGEVNIEVRRSFAALATWSYWRGAPLPEIPAIRRRSDRQGRFRIPVAYGYEYEVRFSKPGYKDFRSVVYANRPFVGLLEKGSSGPPPGIERGRPSEKRALMRAEGVLRDAASGDPVAGARLREFWGTKSLTHSDERGRFQVDCTAEQAKNDLLVVAEGYRLSHVPQSTFGKKVAVEVQLQAGKQLQGRLVDREGRPLAGRLVVLGTDVPVGQTMYGDVAVWKRTDAQGRYEFGCLDKGWRYWLRTLLPSGTPFEIAEGVLPEAGLDLGSAKAYAGFTVEGRVSGPDGKPLSGGRVHVLRLFDRAPTKYQIVRTTPSFPIDGQGRYRIPGLAPYPHELCFHLEGLEHRVRVVQPPEKGGTVSLDVRMGPGRSLRGLVVDGKGKPIGGALLRGMVWSDQEIFPLVPHGDMSHKGRFIAGNVRVLTRPDGTFLLERLRSQLPLRIVCSKEGYETVKIRLAAKPDGKPLRIELR